MSFCKRPNVDYLLLTEIQSWWEVPCIAHFCSLFRSAFDLPDFDIEVSTSLHFVQVSDDESTFLNIHTITFTFYKILISCTLIQKIYSFWMNFWNSYYCILEVDSFKEKKIMVAKCALKVISLRRFLFYKVKQKIESESSMVFVYKLKDISR